MLDQQHCMALNKASMLTGSIAQGASAAGHLQHRCTLSPVLPSTPGSSPAPPLAVDTTCFYMGRWPPADLDKEGQHLASQLMATAASLLTLLQQSLGLASATRMLPLLHQMPPGTAADLLTAMFTRSVALRAAVLQCTEVNERLKLVLQICQQVSY